MDPNKIICIPYCVAYDKGVLIKTPVGQSRTLIEHAGYRWVNGNGDLIQNVACLPFHEVSIGYYSTEESHELQDIDECEENEDLLLCPMKFGKCFNQPGEYECYCIEEGYFTYNNSQCEYGKDL